MDSVEEIKMLIESVFETEKRKFRVKPNDIKNAIYEMAEAYKPDRNWENHAECHTVEYDTAGHRCAYLHKYAMVHTGMVCDIMEQALHVYCIKNIFENKEPLILCSLGSGPGTDILALLFLLVDYTPRKCRAYLIDKSNGWSTVFDSIVKELRTSHYSTSEIASTSYFNYEYLNADLLSSISVNVYNRVKNADIITMIKFVSAAACKKTRPMIEKMFIAMKPGAICLYIDNAAGGFYEMVEEAANKTGMQIVFGSLKHYEYEEIKFKNVQNGSVSQYEAKVTAAVWRKLEVYSQSIQMDCPSYARLQALAEVEYVREKVELQCAREPTVIKGIRSESRIPFDEPSEIIKLHSDSSYLEEEQSDSCCLIM